MPAGRPSIYSDELAEAICEAMSTSDKGLSALCDGDARFPHHATVWRWMHEIDGFREKIVRAREHQADYLAYQGGKILEDATEWAEQGNNAYVALAKAKAEYRLKLVPKIAPRTMGDRSKVQVGGDPDSPPISHTTTHFDASALSDEDRAAALKVIHAGIQRGSVK